MKYVLLVLMFLVVAGATFLLLMALRGIQGP